MAVTRRRRAGSRTGGSRTVGSRTGGITGFHFSGHFSPSMAIRLSPSLAPDALVMETGNTSCLNQAAAFDVLLIA